MKADSLIWEDFSQKKKTYMAGSFFHLIISAQLLNSLKTEAGNIYPKHIIPGLSNQACLGPGFLLHTLPSPRSTSAKLISQC